jgi:hypothetical protein
MIGEKAERGENAGRIDRRRRLRLAPALAARRRGVGAQRNFSHELLPNQDKTRSGRDWPSILPILTKES